MGATEICLAQRPGCCVGGLIGRRGAAAIDPPKSMAAGPDGALAPRGGVRAAGRSGGGGTWSRLRWPYVPSVASTAPCSNDLLGSSLSGQVTGRYLAPPLETPRHSDGSLEGRSWGCSLAVAATTLAGAESLQPSTCRRPRRHEWAAP